ncbi:MAG: hypothetical protein V3R67_00040 [Thermodesulfobacteriota bacterium]|jgi:hypothetical protein|nr:hypothetical protein [Candidatus Dadabacteria bacterium]MCZ6469083.1 hypothetical protein [Candidatus Dadabacteria bacterium]MCZ6528061.1 hypothetical protein [Candidatus Dadabacteria bacterium]MCZ6555152.1 hypothetical protein [Candidatus Dadabacteria bacterium]MCZ6638687.1 hypothetical protein [Candidatus Dadabacteria bacterium]
MRKIAYNYLRTLGLLIILVAVFSTTGCSWLSPGSIEDPGEAVGAPTMPENIREGYEEGAQYPEESF